ncbi:MAG: RluA family pseudouridine synthase [Lachnospiraceae bacterium]|nr:RluA family pseudouridine synthase [Lachnospiraceae bacterium]
MDKRIEIIYEDKDIIVCHKYPGIAVQSARAGEKDMESELKCYLHAKEPDRPLYLAVIHRLDQPVEGVVVFAGNKKAAASLSAQVSAKGDAGMQKEYTAEVFGRMPSDEGTLTDYLVKDAKTNSSSVTDDSSVGKKAVLHYKVKETEDKTQILTILLETGRHHQIRVQLSHAGAPIIGDMKYGSEESMEYSKENDIKTVRLKASRLEFTHPSTKKRVSFALQDN